MTPEEKKELTEKIDELSSKVNRLISYVDSDPATNRAGIVESMDRLSRTVEDLLKREQIYKAKAATFGTIGGGIVIAVWKAITFFATMTK